MCSRLHEVVPEVMPHYSTHGCHEHPAGLRSRPGRCWIRHSPWRRRPRSSHTFSMHSPVQPFSFGREVTTGGRGNVGATVGAAGQTPAAVRFELAAAASGSPGVPRLPACSLAGRACAGHDGSTCARARPRRPLPVGPAKTRALVPVRSTSAPFRGRSRVAFPECSSSRKNR